GARVSWGVNGFSDAAPEGGWRNPGFGPSDTCQSGYDNCIAGDAPVACLLPMVLSDIQSRSPGPAPGRNVATFSATNSRLGRHRRGMAGFPSSVADLCAGKTRWRHTLG